MTFVVIWRFINKTELKNILKKNRFLKGNKEFKIVRGEDVLMNTEKRVTEGSS